MEFEVIDNVDKAFLEQLLKNQGEHLLSLYLPVETAGPDTRQNPIRYKNLVNALAEKTSDRAWLTALHQLEDELEFWQEQKEGMALFSTPDKVTVVKLPFAPPEKAAIGPRFEVLPLFPVLNQNHSFFILKVNLNKMQLLLASRTGEVTEVPIEGDVFTSMEEYFDSFEITQELQFHTIPGSSAGGGRGGAIFHGHGDVTAEQKTQIRRFFDQYQRGITELLNENQLPIVLVGVEYLLPIFREAYDPINAVKDCITQHPESLSARELCERAWECVKDDFEQDQKREQELYQELAETKRTTPFITDIIPYGVEGRVQSLFIRDGAQAWGRYDAAKNEVRLHTEQQPNSENLWERSAQEAFLTGAKVFIIDKDDSFLKSEAGAALLRY